MINLLYVILIAMLAINISGEVLEGFITANRDIKDNLKELQAYNEVLEKQLTKGSKDAETARKAFEMKKELLAIDQRINRLGEKIQTMAHESSFNKNAKVDDNLNAVKSVMLENHQATALKADIEKFKEGCLPLATNEASRKMIANLLDTDSHEKGKTWEEAHFANLPVIGCLMMINKIRKDMWLALNEAMRCATGQVEINDSLIQTIEKAEEKATEKTTLNDNLLDNLIAELEQRNLLNQPQNRIVETGNGNAKILVMTENQAPLFANYENRIKVTLVSENPTHLSVNLSNGTIRKEGDHYVAIPNGKSATATLTVNDGNTMLTQYEYKVLPLPIPTPSLIYTAPNGKQRAYRSSVPLSWKEIQSISQIRLNMDGGVDTKEKVTGFDLMLIKQGNKAVQLAHANGPELTTEMKHILEHTAKGDKLIFTNITVKGVHTPDRQTASVNVIPM